MGHADRGAALGSGGPARRAGPARSRGRPRWWPRRGSAGPGRPAGPGPGPRAGARPPRGSRPAPPPRCRARRAAGPATSRARGARRRRRPRRRWRRRDPCARCRGWWCRTGSRPGAPCAPRRSATPGEISRRSTPSRRIAPAVGSARRHSSLANVVLPDPVSPTTATDVPARDDHVDAAQDLPAVAVGEVEPLGPHLDRPVRQVDARARARRCRAGCRARRAPCATRPARSGSGRGSRRARRSAPAAG